MPVAERLAALARSPLFEMLSDQELKDVAALAEERSCAPGTLLVEEGELGDRLFVIVSGEAEVLRMEENGEQVALTVLGASEFFGEMSVLDKVQRSATVRARTEVELLALSAEQLAEFRAKHRDGYTFLVMNIARVLSGRLRETNARVAPLPPRSR